MKKILILLVAAGLVLTLVPSCKKSDSANTSDGPAVMGVRFGNIAVSFTETDSNGIEFTLESLKGKVILLNFSAMWCGPCRAEVPHLLELYNKYKEQGLEIVQCIFQDEDGNPADIDDLARWIKEFGCPYIVINDPDSSSVNTYNFQAIPFNIVIDRDFVIQYVAEGFDLDEIRRKITQNL